MSESALLTRNRFTCKTLCGQIYLLCPWGKLSLY